MTTARCVGIDVSLKLLSVAVHDEEGPGASVTEYPNTAAGHRRLIAYLLRAKRELRVGLEPTSTYHLALCHALYQTTGCTVFVINPRSVRNFAQSGAQRAKTDRCDAVLLCEYVRRMDPLPWRPPRQVDLALRSLSRRMEDLTKRRTALKNQLHSAQHAPAAAVVLSDLQSELRNVEARRLRLQQAALKVVAGDERLRRHFELLLSVKGIGELSALKLLAELSVLPEGLGKRQWVALAGLDPRPRESGQQAHPPRHISKQGNAHLRGALSNPALVAAQHCPAVRRYYEKLKGRGLAKLAALCAVMRKLLIAIWGMLRSGQPFNPALFSPSSP